MPVYVKKILLTKPGSTTEMLRLLMLQALSRIGRCSVTWNRDLWCYYAAVEETTLFTVLLCIDLKQVLHSSPWCFPTLSMWNVPKPDVCFFVLFYSLFFFFLSRFLFVCLVFIFCSGLLSLQNQHRVFILTAHISSNSKWFLGGISLSLNKWHHKVYCTYFVYVRCLNKSWKVLK